MRYTVYILYSDYLDRYYIGYTSHLIEIRLRKHNSKHKGFTGRNPDWKIIYTECYSAKNEATNRERELKSWKSRVMIEQLTKNNKLGE